jgi:hypothetical protein
MAPSVGLSTSHCIQNRDTDLLIDLLSTMRGNHPFIICDANHDDRIEVISNPSNYMLMTAGPSDLQISVGIDYALPDLP